jgi:hypothetical protein
MIDSFIPASIVSRAEIRGGKMIGPSSKFIPQFRERETFSFPMGLFISQAIEASMVGFISQAMEPPFNYSEASVRKPFPCDASHCHKKHQLASGIPNNSSNLG